jgi:hypothetical protein
LGDPRRIPGAERRNLLAEFRRRAFESYSRASATARRGSRFLFVDRSEVAPAVGPAVVEFIHGGVAVGVATRDDDLRPEFARGRGPEVSADGRSPRLCVTAPEGSRMRANLELNGAVAVGFSPPTILSAAFDRRPVLARS